MRIFLLAQKPIGNMVYDLLREDVVGVCSNTSTDNWWGMPGPTHVNFLSNHERNDDALAALIEETDADTIISVQHPWFVPDQILGLVGMNAINVHLAPLPQYRGYYGPTHAILNGDKSYGVTIHSMAGGLDSGPIIAARSLPIAPDETAYSLYGKAELAAMFLMGLVYSRMKKSSILPSIPQDESDARFYGKDSLDPEVKRVEDISVMARAFYFPPFEPAYFVQDGQKFHIIPEAK